MNNYSQFLYTFKIRCESTMVGPGYPTYAMAGNFISGSSVGAQKIMNMVRESEHVPESNRCIFTKLNIQELPYSDVETYASPSKLNINRASPYQKFDL